MKKIFLLSVIMLVFNAGFSREYSAKIIKQSYEATADYNLFVENKYGDINIKTWNKNEIAFEITLKVGTSDKRKADEILNNVKIAFEQENKTVSAKTVFDEKFKCNNCDLSFNYQIMVPEGVNHNIANKYGHINLPNLNGNVRVLLKYGNLNGQILKGVTSIDVKYGNINLDGTIGPDNALVAAYCSAVNIGQASDIRIDMKYSNLSVKTAEDVKIESAYNKLDFGRVKNLTLSSKYDNCKIAEVNDLNVNAKYTGFAIERLNKNMTADIKYSGTRVNNISSGFEKILVAAGYSRISLSINQPASYSMDLYTKYGDIRTKTKADNVVKADNSHSVKGSVGSSTHKGEIKITNSYADIILD